MLIKQNPVLTGKKTFVYTKVHLAMKLRTKIDNGTTKITEREKKIKILDGLSV